ncbi:MAG: ATPase, T2SS/T4P/T4SS family [Hydrogenoanaerobacterium sp.]
MDKDLQRVAINTDVFYNVQGTASYIDVLKQVQAYMAGQTEFKLTNMTQDEIFRYKKHIENCIITKSIKCKEIDTLSQLIERLYNSMTQFDILTPYLQPERYNHDGIEEIYGRWNCIYILAKNKKIRLNEKFPSSEFCLDILNRIANRFNCNINEGTPTALGEFAPNIRASIVSSPITSKELGADFNIRIVHGGKMKRKLLLDGGTIDERGLRFLELCIEYGANICIGGKTGSGKTGTMYYLLSYMAQDDTYRVGTIEIESREFNLIRYDENGDVLNDVFHWVTRASDDERYDISANTLVETILRFKPDIVGVGEMRNREALMTCELATTGHGAITTIHCSSAADTYSRMVQLCKKADTNFDDDTLYQLALSAFPIVVYQRQNKKTGARRIYEISEGVEYKNRKVVVKPLFQFIVTDNQKSSGTAIGGFKQIGQISDGLRQNMMDSGCTKAELEIY